MPDREPAVELRVTIHARPSTVFRFLSDPERFARWWAVPGGGSATIEPRPGGAVRIQYENGHVMSGEVVALEPDRRFVMLWGYEEETKAIPPSSTRVEIDLEPVDAGTEVTLRHGGLPDEPNRTGHEAGWRYYLSTMAAECARDQLGDRAETAIDDWFAAWSADDETRRGILDRCCAPDVRLTDAFASVDGVATVDAHVANARRHMPPHRVARDGDVALCHEHARARWAATLDDGKRLMSGDTVFRFTLDGRIERVIGFADA